MKYNFIVIVALLMVNCKSESLKDKTLPVITIESPIANQHYNIGDTILIKGNITDINTLVETGTHITSVFDNGEFSHLHYGLLYSNTWNFTVKHKITHSQRTNYIITVEGMDEAGNEAKKDVTISIN
jgi:hypothetical protein